MSAATLMDSLAASGFTLHIVDGDGLSVTPASRLTDDQRSAIRAQKGELIRLLTESASTRAAVLGPEPPPLATADHAAIAESIEERAAILEYDAGTPRPDAELRAASAMRVYRYRVTDQPDRWLTLLAPGCDLEDARQMLIGQFGSARLIEVRDSTGWRDETRGPGR